MTKFINFSIVLLAALWGFGASASNLNSWAPICVIDEPVMYAGETKKITLAHFNAKKLGMHRVVVNGIEQFNYKYEESPKRTFYYFTPDEPGWHSIRAQWNYKVEIGRKGYVTHECVQSVYVKEKPKPEPKDPTIDGFLSTNKSTVPEGTSVTAQFTATDSQMIQIMYRLPKGPFIPRQVCETSSCVFKIDLNEPGQHQFYAWAAGHNSPSGKDTKTVNKTLSIEVTETNTAPIISLKFKENNKQDLVLSSGESATVMIAGTDLDSQSYNQITKVEFTDAQGRKTDQTNACKQSDGSVSCELNTGNVVQNSIVTATLWSGNLKASMQGRIAINRAPVVNKLSVTQNNQPAQFVQRGSQVKVTASATDANNNIKDLQLCMLPGTQVDSNQRCNGKAVLKTCTTTSCSATTALSHTGPQTIYARAEDTLGLHHPQEKTVIVLSDYYFQVEAGSVAKQYVVNDPKTPPTISWQVNANKIYASGRTIKGFRILPGGVQAHAIDAQIITGADKSAQAAKLCATGKCAFTLNWKPNQASYGTARAFRVEAIDDKGQRIVSDEIHANIILALPNKPTTPRVGLELNDNKYYANLSNLGTATKTTLIMYVDDQVIDQYTHDLKAKALIKNISKANNGQQLKVCVIGTVEGANGSVDSDQGCSANETIAFDNTPANPVMDMAYTQFGGSYKLKWKANQDDNATASYSLRYWKGHIADEETSAIQYVRGITATEYEQTNTQLGTHTYILSACNAQNQCEEAPPIVVEHLAPTIAGVKVDEHAKTLTLGGVALHGSAGRLIIQLRNSAETVEISNRDIQVTPSGGVLTAKLSDRLITGYKNKGLVVEFRNGIQCPENSAKSNIPGKVLCVDGMSTYKVIADDQHQDDIVDMTENNFSVSDNGYVYVGAKRKHKDAGGAPFYHDAGRYDDNSIGAHPSQARAGLHIYKHGGGTNNPGWIFATGDDASEHNTVVGKPLVLSDGDIDNVYFGAQNRNVYKISHNTVSASEANLNYVWKQATRGANTAALQTDKNGNIYVGSMDENLYSLRPDTGQINWHYKFTGSGGITSLTGVSEKGLVYVTTQDGEFLKIDRNLLDANAVDWRKHWDYNKHIQPGWEPDESLIETRTIAYLIGALHDKYPSKVSISAMAYAFATGHSLEEVVNAILNAPVGYSEDDLALRGADNNKFTKVLFSRLLNKQATASDLINGKSAADWALQLNAGDVRRAELVLMLYGHTAQVYQDMVKEVVELYYGHCFGVACNYSRDSDGDGVGNWLENQLGLDKNDPRDRLQAPELALVSNDDGHLSFSLKSDTVAHFYRISHQVGNNEPVAYSVIANRSHPQRIASWRKKVMNGQHTFTARSCVFGYIQGERQEACSQDASEPTDVTINDSTSEDPIHVEAAALPSGPINSHIDLAASAALSPTVGSFRVSEGGSATYTVALPLPEGIAGVTPQVSLNYDSQAGDSSIAVGWSLNAGSAIARCRKTEAQDGEFAALQFNDSDSYCLSGQRLIEVNNLDWPMSESNDVLARYVTELDSQIFVERQAYLDGQRFVVYGKDGSKKVYGGDSNSEIRISPNGGSNTVTMTWLLTQESDSIDHPDSRITYSYTTKHAGEGALLLSNIAYSGYQVVFEYESGEVRNRSYVFFDSLTQRARLARIKIENHNGFKTELSRYEISKHTSEPAYNGLRRLDRLQQCRGSVCKRPIEFKYNDFARMHNFSDSKPLFDAGHSGTGRSKLAAFTLMDGNGDGIVELATVEKLRDRDKQYQLCFWGSTDAYDAQKLACRSFRREDNDEKIAIIPVDPEGDGTQSLWINLKSELDRGYNRAYWTRFDFNGSSVTQSTPQIAGLNGHYMREIKFADFNGDGYADLIYKGATNDGQLDDQNLYVSYWKGSRFAGDQELVLSSSAYLSNFTEKGTDWVAADVNFDGLADVISLKCANNRCEENEANAIFIQLNKGGQAFSSRRVYGNGRTIRFLQPADLNGDGLMDLIFQEKNRQDRWQWHALVARSAIESQTYGRSRFKPIPFTTVGETVDALDTTDDNINEDVPPLLMDIDGNGMVELYFKSASARDGSWRRYVWNPESEELDFNGFGPNTEHLDFAEGDFATLADFDNNGTSDLVMRHDDDIYVKMSTEKVSMPGLLKEIRQGYGAKTEIIYGFMNNGVVEGAASTGKPVYSPELAGLSAYQRDQRDDQALFTMQGFKVSSHIGAMPLVASVTTQSPSWPLSDNVADNEVTVNYHYYGAKMQFGGRGWLGFAAVKTSTEKDGYNFDTVTRYRQAFPYTGLPKSTEKRFDNILLSLANNRYSSLDGKHDKSVYTYMAGSWQCSARVDDVSNSYAISGHNCQSVTTSQDKWGNVFSNAVSQFDVSASNVEDFVSGSVSTGTKLSTVATNNCYGNSCSVNEAGDSDYEMLGRLTDTKVTHSKPGLAASARESRFEYFDSGDTRFMLSKEIVNEGKGCDFELTTSYTYDAWGNTQKQVATPSGCEQAQVTRSKTYEYDNGHHLSQVVNDYFGEGEVKQRNEFGLPIESTNVHGVVTTSLYDTFGVEIGSYSETGAQSYSYLEACHGVNNCAVQRVKEVNGEVVERQYLDVSGRVFRVKTRGLGDGWYESNITFDKYGRELTSQAPGSAAVSTRYDAFDRTIEIADPNAGTLSKFTVNDLTTTVTVSAMALDSMHGGLSANQDKGLPGGYQRQEITVSDALGKVVSKTDNAGHTLTYGYDVWGNQIEVFSSVDNKVVAKSHYDLLGRLEYRQTPNAGKWQYAFNAFGEMRSQTDARGLVTRFSYDKLGRKIAQGADGLQRWDYRNSPNLQFAENAKWQERYFYDSMGRPAGKVTGVDERLKGICTGSVEFNTETSDIRINSTVSLNPARFLCVVQQNFYDEFGRLERSFDDYRRVSDNTSLSLPLGYHHAAGQYVEARGVKRTYNRYGKLIAIQEARNADNGVKYYEVTSANSRGQVTGYNKGLAEVSVGYDSQGMVASIEAHKMDEPGGETYIQGDTYRFDSLGNLTYRSQLGGGQERFSYDALNRLTHVNDQQRYQYCDNGSLKVKDGWSQFYGTGQCDTHRLESRTAQIDTVFASAMGGSGLKSAGPMSFASGSLPLGTVTETFKYDANGNETEMVRQLGDGEAAKVYRTQTYSARNKVTRITDQDGKHVTFDYDVNNRRFKRWDGGDQTVYYVGSLELTWSKGERFIRRYIGNDAVQIYRDEGASRLQWLFTDHQGSVTTVTDNSLKLLKRFSYDAFGKRREVQETEAYITQHYADNVGTSIFDAIAPNLRSYTGHEPVSLGGDNRIIHMGGRIYDADTGRFMQADPVIQAPGNLQNYNAYSYVLNNPLSYTDPSGYLFKKLGKFIKKHWRPILAVAAAVVTYGAAVSAFTVSSSITLANGAVLTASYVSTAGYIAAGAISGAVSGAIATGSAKGALSGALSGAVFAGIGQAFTGNSGFFKTGGAGHIGTHAVAGGILTDIQGGKFGHGFISAGINKGVGSRFLPGSVRTLGEAARGTVVSAMIGGTVSQLTGGKFGNGARTGAMQYLYNRIGKTDYGKIWKDAKRTWSDYWSSTIESEHKNLMNANGTVQGASTAGGSAMVGVVGKAMDAGVVLDSQGNMCLIANDCTRLGVGLGASTAAMWSLNVADAPLQSSTSEAWGAFVELPVASGQILLNDNSLGLGRAKGGLSTPTELSIGIQHCTTTVVCKE
ncbi:hypothetical protein PRUB_b0687 [Pseudoalteromonas rubra]|uniref:Insecticide toxin TcdB middle/N-terminal domain-containing protein n=1 Tax=Pseudoalteromonas rubra TaxID=43658 RepID=A0A8T0C0F8_9GAMM|nr:FG-GAP-like repeat-containing protein [Pseudoalteromonas rubra]KAF7781460.1 hypothetical protein PRUB_b0687 [Pseudoalteromonas rubra]